MNTLAEWAARYAKQQWPIFPLKPGHKTPATRNGFHDATTNPAQIDKWWARNPDYNIGCATGHKFDVLDVDYKHGAPGYESLAELWEEHGTVGGPVVATPSGGIHRYFLPAGLGRIIGFRPGLDWCGQDGYVVLPPSRLEQGDYQWVITPREDRMVTVPQWLIDKVKPPKVQRLQPAIETLLNRPQPVTGISAYGAAAFDDETNKLLNAQPGQRNDQLNRSAFNLIQLAHAGHLDMADTITALHQAGLNVGLDDKETIRTIKSALDAAQAKPR